MRFDIVVTAIVVEIVKIVLLTLVHPAYGCSRHQHDTLFMTVQQGGFLQSLLHGNHTHQRSSCGGFCRDAELLLHLVIAHLDFTYRKLMMVST